VSELPKSWFVDEQRPQVGEIWEDAEGVLYTVAPVEAPFGGRTQPGVWAFATSKLIPVGYHKIDKPMARAFDTKGNFVLDRPLRYPNGSAIRSKEN